MTRNVCGKERTWRAIIGLILIIIGFAMQRWIIGVLGALPFLTAIFSYSPINETMHRNTCWKKEGPVHQNPS